MKIVHTGEDEAKIYSFGASADCYFLGDGEAEIKIDGRGRHLSVTGAELFALRAVKKLEREDISAVYFIADGNSETAELMRKSRRFTLSKTEYMFALRPDPDRKAEDGAGLLFVNVTGEEDTIIVRSGEKDVFTAKLRPYNGGMYIYGVEVREDLRHRGYGTRYMRSLAYAFREKALYLQVGSPNEIACRLYRHAGFEIETEMVYYEIDAG